MTSIKGYVLAGVGVFTLGYCTGHCGRAETPVTSPASTPISSLEKTVAVPVQISQQVPEPQQPIAQPLTMEQRFLLYLKNPSRTGADPLPSPVPFKRPKNTADAGDNLLEKLDAYACQTAVRVRNEVVYTYREAKDYLREKIGGIKK